MKNKPISVLDLSLEEIMDILSNLQKRCNPVQIGQGCRNGHTWNDKAVFVEHGKRVIRCLKCKQISSRKSYEKTPTAVIRERNNRPSKKAKMFDMHLRIKYGLSLARWLNMWHGQNGKCAGCERDFPTDKHGQPERGVLVHVDHDHETGVVRSLLCYTCNRMVGVLEHKNAPKLLKYLIEHDSGLGKNL